MNTGWYAILRSGILDHLLAGKLGYPEIGIYTTIHLQADFKTGISRRSAPTPLAAAPAPRLDSRCSTMASDPHPDSVP